MVMMSTQRGRIWDFHDKCLPCRVSFASITQFWKPCGGISNENVIRLETLKSKDKKVSINKDYMCIHCIYKESVLLSFHTLRNVAVMQNYHAKINKIRL